MRGKWDDSERKGGRDIRGSMGVCVCWVVEGRNVHATAELLHPPPLRERLELRCTLTVLDTHAMVHVERL